MFRLPVTICTGRSVASLSHLLTIVLFATSCAPSGADRGAPVRQPNIIVFLADDLGYGQVGAYGSTTIRTPNIDRLAENGITFTDAYASNTVCSPSRVGLMTGRDSRLLHGQGNTIKLRPSDRTIAHVLRDAGYHTALVGKYGIGTTFGVNDPMAMGFDEWYGLVENTSAHRQYPTHVFENNNFQIVPENIGGAKIAYAQELFTERAKDILEAERSEPLFLVIAFTSPHAELAAPSQFIEAYEDAFDERPYEGRDGSNRFRKYYPEPVEKPAATQAGMISALDSYVGEVVDLVNELGLAENTMVLFTSDNGPHAESGADPARMKASGVHRGYKRDLYEGGIRVPAIVSWPGVTEKGRTDDTPWSFADLMPTFAELASVDLERETGVVSNGVSIAPLLHSSEHKLGERYIYWDYRRGPGELNVAQAARFGKWKAVRHQLDANIELYDLNADPGETKDLAAERPDVIEQFQRLLETEVR